MSHDYNKNLKNFNEQIMFVSVSNKATIGISKLYATIITATVHCITYFNNNGLKKLSIYLQKYKGRNKLCCTISNKKRSVV